MNALLEQIEARGYVVAFPNPADPPEGGDGEQIPPGFVKAVAYFRADWRQDKKVMARTTDEALLLLHTLVVSEAPLEVGGASVRDGTAGGTGRGAVFQLREVSRGREWTFELVDAAGEILLKGTRHSSRAYALRAIEEARGRCAEDGHFARTTTPAGRSGFSLKAADGRMLAGGTFYQSASRRDEVIAACVANAASAPTREMDESLSAQAPRTSR